MAVQPPPPPGICPTCGTSPKACEHHREGGQACCNRCSHSTDHLDPTSEDW